MELADRRKRIQGSEVQVRIGLPVTFGLPLTFGGGGHIVTLPALVYHAVAGNAQVAQSVEQWTENPRVGGSIPSLGTIPSLTADGRMIRIPQVACTANRPLNLASGSGFW